MIEFKEIRYKNFLSSGNQFTSIKLNQNTNTLIVGQNGAGKSTILDALCFSLFNKPFRKINKNQIVNSSNEKDCVVEIDFNINRNEYKVIRGIKPGIFEIYQNGKKMNEDASSQDQQKMLENNILKLNYKSFTQIVILGSASFVPFMQLPAAHRREVIEDLLDIKVFSSMSEILKNKIKDAKETVKTLELKKESIADKIIMQQNFIKQIEETGQNDIKDKQTQISECEEEVSKYNESVSSLLQKVQDKQQEIEQYTDASDTLRKLGTFKGKIGNKKQNSNEELEFFKENSVCPTCTQTIEETFRVNKIEELQQVISSYESNLQEIEDTIKKEEEREQAFFGLQREITKLQNEISQINIRISNANKSKSTLEKEIQTITTRLENRNTEHEKLSEYKTNLRQILLDLEQLKEDYGYYLQANVLLKDDGVKSSIIKKYLPLINQQVNKYLQMMDFFINFTLDEEFNEKIQTPIHENFSYASFSEGEKMRIDLSLLFTWREIARLKNSISTNLLIMDEVFDSSLDGLGTDEFFKIIRYVVSDANIFIISHKNELHEKFENVLEFHKVKGFSQLKS
jgi:DNA repair exonuclease SbcCD ATPase subunit